MAVQDIAKKVLTEAMFTNSFILNENRTYLLEHCLYSNNRVTVP